MDACWSFCSTQLFLLRLLFFANTLNEHLAPGRHLSRFCRVEDREGHGKQSWDSQDRRDRYTDNCLAGCCFLRSRTGETCAVSPWCSFNCRLLGPTPDHWIRISGGETQKSVLSDTLSRSQEVKGQLLDFLSTASRNSCHSLRRLRAALQGALWLSPI